MKRWIHSSDYIPDVTERHPEGMSSYIDDSNWTTDVDSEERLIDAVTEAKHDVDDDGYFCRRVEVHCNILGYHKEFASLDELLSVLARSKMLANMIVSSWGWYDEVVKFNC